MSSSVLLPVALAVALVTLARTARAEDPAPPPSPAAPDASATPLTPSTPEAIAPCVAVAPRPELRNVFRGIVLLGAGLDTGHFGAAVRGVAGAQWLEIRTFQDRRFVARWNGFVRGTGGILGNTKPVLGFVGAQLDLDAEVGVRTAHAKTWSPYVGVGGAFRLGVVALPAVPMRRYDTINDPRGVAGVNGVLSVRLSLGVSDVGARHALHLTAFLQEAARAPETFSSIDLFTEPGVRVQLDVPRNVQIVVEGSYGFAPAMFDPIFHAKDRGRFLEGSFAVRKHLRRFWFAIDFRISQRRDRTTDPSGVTYDTRELITTASLLSWGFSL